MLPMIMPNPMGMSKSGSYSLVMARRMNVSPIAIMTAWPTVKLANAVYSKNCTSWFPTKSKNPGEAWSAIMITRQ